MKNYFGKVAFEDKAGKTLIRWSVDLTPKIPFTGGICWKAAKGAIHKLIDSVEKHHA